MRSLLCILGVVLALMKFAPIARAEAGDELSIYVMTMGSGDEIFEKFGHNTIRVVDRSTGDDMVYNWGVFDFNQRGFFLNFALGDLDYACESETFDQTAQWYKSLDRSMWLQELHLSPAQKLRVRDKCRWYDTDQHRFYRYNYYTDNCSTRVRDVLDEALDGQIKAQLSPLATQTTYRWQTRRLTRESVPWYFLLDTAIGPAADRPISRWEEAFLPVKFSGYLKTLTIKDVDGKVIPLTHETVIVYQSTRPPEPAGPPMWWPWFLLAGVAIGAIFVWMGRAAEKRKSGRILFAVAGSVYTLGLGLCACIGLGFWFCTAHWAAWRNENLFAYSPLALPLVVLIPLMLGKRGRGKRPAKWLAMALAASTLIGLALSPILPQTIADPMALALPINLALAWVVWHYIAKTRQPRINMLG